MDGDDHVHGPGGRARVRAAPVDPDHVVSDEPGWYDADFHMHGYHSNAQAPEWARDRRAIAVAEGLDIVFATEYVTGQHWDELGPVQEANPDVLVLAGAGDHHLLRARQRPRRDAVGARLPPRRAGRLARRHPGATVDDGALFQVNHPTIFPEAQFGKPVPGL